MNKDEGLNNRTPASRASWQTELAQAFTRPAELLQYLNLDHGPVSGATEAAQGFRMLVPRGFAALMRPGDPRDPLLLQVLPSAAEHLTASGYSPDPVNDAAACRAPGLLQKYAGRVLLVATGACAVHCRYCFRRHFPYADHGGGRHFDAALEAIAAAHDLHEVILSGGDPLMLGDDTLSALITRLEGLPQLRRLRLHTRLPVVLSSRVTPALCRVLTASRLRTVIVVHVNHAAELGDAAARALGMLRKAGIPLFNQSVLLRGINDDAGVLAELAERLFDLGVINYYLHQLDRVEGAAHFEVDDDRARQLITTLRAHLPGYLVPRLVREVAGALSKTPLDSC
ncbi:MAG: EF-P beta-lysylation protein EpmB [Thiohalocapsa sp.]